MGATLNSIKKDIEQFSKNMNSNGEESASPTEQPVVPSQTKPSQQANNKKSAAGLFEQASSMFNRWMPNSKKQGSPSSADSGDDPSQSSAGGLQGLLAMGLCVGLFFGACWLLSRRQTQPPLAHLSGAASIAIATRADIVRAFHALVGTSGLSVEEWWTHRRAASELSRLKPATKRDLELLSGLYEIARYSPTNYQLTEEQIQQARHAVEQISTC